MKINTERLVMVPLGLEHLVSTHKYAGDLANTKYMVHLPNTDMDETRSFLQKVQDEWKKPVPEFYEFAVLLDNEHIGAVSIDIEQDKAEGELGWIIGKEYWGNGYAVEAAREVINFAVQECKVKKIIAHCDSENINSYKVMKKLGMLLVSKERGRKNKLSDEDREELMCALEIS